MKKLNYGLLLVLCTQHIIQAAQSSTLSEAEAINKIAQYVEDERTSGGHRRVYSEQELANLDKVEKQKSDDLKKFLDEYRQTVTKEEFEKVINAEVPKRQSTPLALAVLYGFIDKARVLLEAGADPNKSIKPQNKTAPLYVAFMAAPLNEKKNTDQIITLLLEHHANPHINYGKSTLYEVLKQKRPGLAPVLEKFGADTTK